MVNMMPSLSLQRAGHAARRAGKNIKAMRDKFGVSLDIDDTSPSNPAAVMSYHANQEASAAALAKHIEDAVTDIETGGVYSGCKAVKVLDIGAVFELPGGRDCLVHISELSHEPVESVAAAVSVGDVLSLIHI